MCFTPNSVSSRIAQQTYDFVHTKQTRITSLVLTLLFAGAAVACYQLGISQAFIGCTAVAGASLITLVIGSVNCFSQGQIKKRADNKPVKKETAGITVKINKIPDSDLLLMVSHLGITDEIELSHGKVALSHLSDEDKKSLTTELKCRVWEAFPKFSFDSIAFFQTFFNVALTQKQVPFVLNLILEHTPFSSAYVASVFDRLDWEASDKEATIKEVVGTYIAAKYVTKQVECLQIEQGQTHTCGELVLHMSRVLGREHVLSSSLLVALDHALRLSVDKELKWQTESESNCRGVQIKLDLANSISATKLHPLLSSWEQTPIPSLVGLVLGGSEILPSEKVESHDGKVVLFEEGQKDLLLGILRRQIDLIHVVAEISNFSEEERNSFTTELNTLRKIKMGRYNT